MTVREITTHRCTLGMDELVKVLCVVDGHYQVTCGNAPLRAALSLPEPVDLVFQDGPCTDNPNGFTVEAFLAVIIDRLEQFQKGPFPCRENAIAITKLQEAMHWLHSRTRDRAMRGVEGRETP